MQQLTASMPIQSIQAATMIQNQEFNFSARMSKYVENTLHTRRAKANIKIWSRSEKLEQNGRRLPVAKRISSGLHRISSYYMSTAINETDPQGATSEAELAGRSKNPFLEASE